MNPSELLDFLQHAGRDPSRLIFEDELTGIHNRRFLHSYLEHKVHWDSGADYPLSLLIADLDRFKQVNDTHGHVAGDQLLTWVAAVLSEVGGENGLPVRYGGDEFILLLPHTDGDHAREVAARAVQRVRDRPFRLRDAGVAIPVTLSIGVATAPGDATSGRSLMQAADTALYHAKLSGRDQVTRATEVDPKKVFPRTAVHRLLASGIAGRDAELRLVSDALVAFSGGASQFLLFEGAPGMGKTTFLDAIARNIAAGTLAVAMVGGDQQEAFRPYYLATRILVALLNQRADKGAGLLQSLTAEDLAHLSQIVPQVGEQSLPTTHTDESTRRQRTFGALARLMPRVVDGRPLVILIDDLQFADEATLLVIRALLQGKKIPLLVCGTTLEALSLGREEEAPPIERLHAAKAQVMGIRRVKLTALTKQSIGEYLRSVFPNLQVPDGFETELARVTQGNPLFLGEIIRKLVADRQVTLVGQEWVIAPLEPGYLPQSLEAVVMEKIAALDAESRRLLDQAATLGEGVPLSVLTGSSELDENRVLQFLDRAEALGLVSLDFQVNDDVMRFLGKRVLEISYGAMDQRRRQVLHGQVGAYQEGLYQQRMLPSASLLAYHFKRSANDEKARRYEQAQLTHAQTMFDPAEAAQYTADLLEEETEASERLSPEAFALVPQLLRAFMTAVRSIQLYPPESKAIPRALQQVTQECTAILTTNPWLQLSQDGRVLLANGQRLDVSEWSALAESFLSLLDHFELQAVTFQRGATEEEFRGLLTAVAGSKPEALDARFWTQLAQDLGLAHIQPKQVRYSKIVRGTKARQPGAEVEDQALDAQDLGEVPKILRAFQAAAKVVKLYPLESEPVTQAAERLHAAVSEVLRRRPALTLAGVEHKLLANGARVETTEFETVAAGAVDLLETAGLQSVTFLAGLPVGEVAALVGALRDAPASGAEQAFWDEFVRVKQPGALVLNQRQYAMSVVDGMLGPGSTGEAGESPEGADAAAVAQLSGESVEVLVQAVPRFGKELLVKGEHALLRRLLRRLFDDFGAQNPAGRAKVVQGCRLLLERLILGLQHTFAEIGADFLLMALAAETEPLVLRELAAVLHDMASPSIQFGDYQLASRILQDLAARQVQLTKAGDRDAERLAAMLDRRLDPAALKLVDEDMRSDQPERQERAAQILAPLGPAGVPLLIDVIKQENDFRSRQLAARLLSDAGPHAADQVRRSLATEVIVEQRARLLEVIDMVTPDLRHELQHCLRDSNPKVRRAAFQLFERLRQDDLIPLVVPFARSPDPAVVRAAIRGLAALRTAAGVQALVSLLQGTGDPNLAVLCCQALGQAEQDAAIDALSRVLSQRKVLFFGRRWSAEVRATAAMALKQIPHPRAAGLLSRYGNDGHVEVAQLART